MDGRAGLSSVARNRAKDGLLMVANKDESA